MTVIILLAILAITVAFGFLVAFIWATKNGQFDDTVTPAIRILFDNQNKTEKKRKKIDKNHIC